MPTEPRPPSEPNASLDRYTILAELGQGGMAEVFLAVSRGFGGFSKLLVLKRLRSELALDESMATMFLDEARLAARLNHLNIVQTYEVGRIDERYFIAMEYLEGQPLTRITRRGLVPPEDRADAKKTGRVPLPLALRIATDMCAGLHYAHELRDFDGTPLQVVHRDVSPHNVFVTYDGHVKLVDFGIALASTRTTETETGVLKGKVAYMPPEQAQGRGVDRRADIFSAGVVLFEMVTGQRLWAQRGDVDVLRDLLNGQVPTDAIDRHGIPAAIARVLSRALAPKRDDRYPSALEMRQDLLRCADAADARASIDDLSTCLAAMFASERAETAAMIDRRLREIDRAEPAGEGPRTPVAITIRPPRILDRTPPGGTQWGHREDESAQPGAVGRTDARAAGEPRRQAKLAVAVTLVAASVAVVGSLQRGITHPEARSGASAASRQLSATRVPGAVDVVAAESPSEPVRIVLGPGADDGVSSSGAPAPPTLSDTGLADANGPPSSSPRPLGGVAADGKKVRPLEIRPPHAASTARAAPDASATIDPLGDRK
jgi:serine/threonine-protein kinase